MSVFFENENIVLYQENCLKLLDEFASSGKKFDMIFADPPYNLSNGGTTCSGGRRVSVHKGDWDKSNGLEQDANFTYKWLQGCKNILADNGTIWVSGTLHSIYVVGYKLQKLGFHILNDISWFKPNAPPHLACRYFTHSHETLLWARKSKKAKHYFDYQSMKQWDASSDLIKNEGKQMRSVWSIHITPPREKTFGRHKTQKPEELLRRVILSSTKENDLILDPFCGSGTTGVIAQKFNRRFIGIDVEISFLEIAKKRILNSKNSLLEIAKKRTSDKSFTETTLRQSVFN